MPHHAKAVFILLLAAATAAPAQTLMPIPPFDRTWTHASRTRGLWFTAPTEFRITGLRVPDESGHGLQNVEVVILNAVPPAWSASTNDFVSVARHVGIPSSEIIPVDINIDTGEIVGILAACGDGSTMRNSYAAVNQAQSEIFGSPVTVRRFGMQHNLATTPAQDVWDSNNPITRVEVYYEPATAPCYADCNTDGTLDINDFLCFIDEFAQAQSLPPAQQQSHYANCTGATAAPFLDINDFLCFIDEFAQGCP